MKEICEIFPRFIYDINWIQSLSIQVPVTVLFFLLSYWISGSRLWNDIIRDKIPLPFRSCLLFFSEIVMTFHSLDVALIVGNNYHQKKSPGKNLTQKFVCENELIWSTYLFNPVPCWNKIFKYNHSLCNVSKQLLCRISFLELGKKQSQLKCMIISLQ